MYKFEISWNDSDPPIPYTFQTRTEAKAFQLALVELETRLLSCPPISQIEVVEWDEPIVDEPAIIEVVEPVASSTWMQLLFSLFVGGWSAGWWHLFVGSGLLVEYLLIGSSATFVVLLLIVIRNWFKSR